MEKNSYFFILFKQCTVDGELNLFNISFNLLECMASLINKIVFIVILLYFLVNSIFLFQKKKYLFALCLFLVSSSRVYCILSTMNLTKGRTLNNNNIFSKIEDLIYLEMCDFKRTSLT